MCVGGGGKLTIIIRDQHWTPSLRIIYWQRITDNVVVILKNSGIRPESHPPHSSVVIRRGSSPSPHRWSAQWEKPPEPTIELRSAIQQADEVPTELRHILKKMDNFSSTFLD
jgi:hypothetical protein